LPEGKVPSEGFAAFGGGLSETAATPQALLLLALAALLIFILPRKHVIAPVLLAIFLIPMGNVVVIAGVHIMPVRMIVVFGGARMAWGKFSSHEQIVSGGWNAIDTAFLCWALFRAMDFVLLWHQVPALINQFGFLWSDVGIYVLLRYLIRNDADIRRTIKVFALIATLNGAEMAYERLTGRNLFGLIPGGVSPISAVRDGTIRSQGAFGHPILAGTFATTLVPLLFWLWKGGGAKLIAATAGVLVCVMIVTTGSSTPVLACAAAILGLCLWPIRGRMRLVRWGIVGYLVCMQLVMKAPVWFLLNHVNIIGASSGYHRSMLIDNFVRHFGDWWLLGTKSTADWGWDMFDLANQFVAEGEAGGLAAFIFFVLMIKRAFGALGTARKSVEGDKRREWLLWSLGATLFAFVVAFFGISLWDQTQVAWLALFAMISAAGFTSITKRNMDGEMPSAAGIIDTNQTREVAAV
jgi:hypothetical protein